MQLVTDNANALSRALGIKAKELENILGFWVNRYPHQEREDAAQNLSLQLLQARPDNPKHAFGICRKATAYWWRQYAVRQHYSLDYVLENDEGDRLGELADFVSGCFQYELTVDYVDGKLDGESLWKRLPELIRPIISKRLTGKRLSDAERQRLHRWVKADGVTMLLAC